MTKEFKLRVKPAIVLYDEDFNEVRQYQIDSGYVVYKLKGFHDKKFDIVRTPVYYAVEVRDSPFVVYVDKLICTDEGLDVTPNRLFCVDGKLRSKLVATVYDKKVLEFLRNL